MKDKGKKNKTNFTDEKQMRYYSISEDSVKDLPHFVSSIGEITLLHSKIF